MKTSFRLKKNKENVIMCAIGFAEPTFTNRLKQTLHFPDMGFTSNVSDCWQRRWAASKSLFGDSLSRVSSLIKQVEPENQTPALRPLQQGLRQVSDFQGCHSTDFLESKMEPVGIIPDAISKVKRVSKSFVERRDYGRRRKWSTITKDI